MKETTQLFMLITQNFKRNALVIANTLFQQEISLLFMVITQDFKRMHWSQQTPSSNNKREDSTHGITRWPTPKSDRLYSLQPKMEKLYTVRKTRLGADCGSDHELLIAKFRLKLKKVGKTARPFNPVQWLSRVRLIVTP